MFQADQRACPASSPVDGSGLVHRGVVKIIDLEGIKTGKKELFRPLDYRTDEVIFPAVADITFPLRNAKERSIKLGSEFWKELVGDSSPSGAVEDREQEPARREDDQEDDLTERFRKIVVAGDKAKRRNAPITFQRLLDIGPTIGIPGISCPACELTGKDHSQACRDRFNEAYLKIADEELGKKLDGVTPEKIIPSSVSAGSATAASGTGEAESPHATSSTLSYDEIDAMISSIIEYTTFDSLVPEDEPVDALVTRLLDRQETLNNPKALAAIRKEADGLIGEDTFLLKTVKEHEAVIREAKRTGKKVHIGSLMTICSEKFAELEEQFRVLKGRVV